MKTYKNVSELLSELRLDERVTDGIFSIENNEHMEVLREKLSQMGLDEKTVNSMSNKVLEGKYPERQAYNARGILVTFPNPEYKQRAIQRGTHFEEDPTKGQSNIDFQGGDQPTPAQPVKEPSVQVEPSSEPKSNLDLSEPSTAVAPADAPSQDDLKTRSPEEKKDDAEEVGKILTTSVSLEEAIKSGWTKNNFNQWYDANGVFKGREWYCIDSRQKKILMNR